MAESEKNARRSDEAERSRHISATESVAFATMLLGLLNDADTVLHRMEHEGQSRATEPAVPQAHSEAAALTPADAGPAHEVQHAVTIDVPAADLSAAIHADAVAAVPPQDASAIVDDTSSAKVLITESSPAPSTVTASIDHAPSASTNNTASDSIAPPSLDLGASVHSIADTVTGIVDTALATVSSTIASLSATATQLTSTVTDTVSHLTDGLLGTLTGSTHDAPSTGVLEPLVADLVGPALSPADVSNTTSHGASLLDTAGAIPTSLLHPMPLQLGFLGQPTMDGHEPHDGAFSALGVHHF
ncbi:hypothetical protein [Bradyrhizobium valentinum]|uniref:Uncharacterized protein n=1 Tax=Bradyrhizobium valentinum TaxID=1518501 RepID=A0A0R3LKZ1_9BRAD|nr:hypothetical protein [Bradyrhizobium valentinum]KRR04219.1 hypothetical protein CP49_23635 [Bradyrhizobium valentinum]KRR05840.1 hypothetical protein CQ10_02140 [Bradyrhizobium valentinum]